MNHALCILGARMRSAVMLMVFYNKLLVKGTFHSMLDQGQWGQLATWQRRRRFFLETICRELISDDLAVLGNGSL